MAQLIKYIVELGPRRTEKIASTATCSHGFSLCRSGNHLQSSLWALSRASVHGEDGRGVEPMDTLALPSLDTEMAPVYILSLSVSMQQSVPQELHRSNLSTQSRGLDRE